MSGLEIQMVKGGLARFRRTAGLTQKIVAGRMRVSQSRVSTLERSWPAVHLNTLQRYVSACGARAQMQITLSDEVLLLTPAEDVRSA